MFGQTRKDRDSLSGAFCVDDINKDYTDRLAVMKTVRVSSDGY